MVTLALALATLLQGVAFVRSLSIRRYTTKHSWVWIAFVATLSLMLARRLVATYSAVTHSRNGFEAFDVSVTLAIALGALVVVEAAIVWLRDLERTRSLVSAGEERFMRLVDSLDDVVYFVGTDGRYLAMYGRWMSEHGLTIDDFVGKRPQEVLPKETAALYDEHNRRALAGETVVYDAWSEIPWGRACYHTIISPVRGEDGSVVAAVGVGRDVTQERLLSAQLEHEKDYAESIIQTADMLIAVVDAECKVTVFNRAAETLTGLSAVDVIGVDLFETDIPDDRFRHRWAELAGDGGDELVCIPSEAAAFSSKLGTRAGRDHTVAWRMTPIDTGEGGRGAVLLGSDMTDSLRLARELEKAAASDPVTGVSSRAAFDSMLAAQIAHAADGESAALMLMVVDGIDTCEARFGRAFADSTLKSVASTLGNVLRPADRLARATGNEFAALLAGGTIEQAAEVARSLREAVAGLEFRGIKLDLSVGVAPVSAETPAAEVYDAALRAMHVARLAGVGVGAVPAEPDDA